MATPACYHKAWVLLVKILFVVGFFLRAARVARLSVPLQWPVVCCDLIQITCGGPEHSLEEEPPSLYLGVCSKDSVLISGEKTLKM